MPKIEIHYEVDPDPMGSWLHLYAVSKQDGVTRRRTLSSIALFEFPSDEDAFHLAANRLEAVLADHPF